MDPPSNTSRPFFAYGLFRPGELGFLRFKGLVDAVDETCNCPGELLLRDGLPILKKGSSGTIPGTVINFKQASASEAYHRVCDLEPDTQYRWDTLAIVRGDSSEIPCNILVGKSPDLGSRKIEPPSWRGQDDPLFKEAFVVIEETVKSISKKGGPEDVKPTFQAQMAYMLLWSAIERYTSLRYYLGREAVWNKVKKLACEDAFAKALQANVQEERKVQRADDPTKRVYLRPQNPVGSLDYYYQVRSNIAHRGKTAAGDFNTVNSSLNELIEIFRSVLRAAFEEAKYP